MSSQDLDPYFKALAKKEVGENPKHVKAHLASFKRWLTACPHLTIPLNDSFLLGFLRYAHYEHSEAQRRIDNFCTLRCSDKTTSRWYNYHPSLDEPAVEIYLKSGVFVPLGFLKSGTYVILMNLTDWSIDDLDYLTMRRLNSLNYERLLLDERCQIGGFCLFIDLANITMEQTKQWGDWRESRAAFRLMQEASPGRTKNIVFYNETKLFDAAYKMIQVWLSDKMKKRIIRVGTNISKAYKKIPGLQDILPIEYGGNNGKMNEAKERNRKEFLDFYSKGFPLKDIAVDESKRPMSAQNYLREYTDTEPALMGCPGTYVQLDPID